MADPVKRLHYFNHQFLRENDFTDEQNYHIRMRREHNRVLHTWGIAEGLGLSFTSGESRVTVGEGIAFSGKGQEIVLAADTQTPDLSGFANKTVYVTIKHDEQPTDPSTETDVTGKTRWTETPIIEVSEKAPGDPSETPTRDPSDYLILGRVTVGADGKVSGTDEGVEPHRRRSAGVVAGDLEVRSLVLKDPGVVNTQWARMRLGAAKRADVEGSLRVAGNAILEGNVGIGTTSPVAKLHISGGQGTQLLALEGDGIKLFNAVVEPTLGNRVVRFNNGSGVPSGGFEFYADDPLINKSLVMIQNGGNVGIGTTNPSSLVHLSSGAGTTDLRITNTVVPVEGVVLTGLTGGLNRMVLGTLTPHDLAFSVGNATRMTIKEGSGNVGIGTTSPQRKLEISGDVAGISFEGFTASPNAGAIRFGDNTGWKLHVGRSREAVHAALNSGTAGVLMTIQDNGNVGIGTAEPTNKLHISDNTGIRQNRLYLSGGDGWSSLSYNAHHNAANKNWVFPDPTRPAVTIEMDDAGGTPRFQVWSTTSGAKTGWQQRFTINGDTGEVSVLGRLIAPNKQGFVVDQFVNNLGETLEEGDVVVIGDNQASLYYGPNNSVPILEVDIAQRAYDTRVCGIVSEVHAELKSEKSEEVKSGAKVKKMTEAEVDKKSGKSETVQLREFTSEEFAKLDRTQVKPGQIGGMVTLGAYAHCKVDADIAPIAVGDLLTTSPTKGHAQKVLDPNKATGAILGKALGSLKKGKGKIPVMVMLQ